jgi:putative ABC transport system permease protein
VLSVTLVDVFTGVFDPPPDVLSIPWGYLVGVGLSVVATVVIAGLITLRALRRPALEELRDL